jgi:hypothetical protein
VNGGKEAGMDLRFKDELARMPDLRHRLRRLRWFRSTFRANASAITATYGVGYKIDESRLTAAFLDWIETLETDKRLASVDRADFIVFAAGMVLCELIRRNPATAILHEDARPEPPQGLVTAEIIKFWPEGFLYTNYCVAVVAAVHEQEFGHATALDKCADDLRVWWSYRENVREMPAYAVAFLDRFLGGEPNWIAPAHAMSRSAMQRALNGLTPTSRQSAPPTLEHRRLYR